MLDCWRPAQYGSRVSRQRVCSKPSCTGQAVATLTYIYSDCTAVLGPLATYAEPHCYDLCQKHSERLTAPVGWEVVRLEPDPDSLKPSSDDIEALANAVREAARPREEAVAAPDVVDPPSTVEVSRKGHLRVLRSVD
jgi:hypothetical protein